MKIQTPILGKIFAIPILSMTLASFALADEVHFTGSTLGQFNVQPYAATNSILDLVYSSSTFNNTTVGNMLSLGGAPNPGANYNNLGSFSLGSSFANYNGNTFTVQVSFTSPTVIAGGSTTVFNSIIAGTVMNGNGGVYIDFDNTPQMYSFSNANAQGAFSMHVNDLSIAPGQAASVTATIIGSQQPIPEPISMIGLGIAGLGLLRKLRKA